MKPGVLPDNTTAKNISHGPVECFGDNALILSPTVNIALNVFYVVITVLGLLSNGLVIHLFISKKVQSTAFNLLLLNLSIADIIADISAYPYVFVNLPNLRNYSDSTANLICTLSYGMTPFMMASSVTIFTLCFISVIRFLMIKYPLRSYWTKDKRNIIIFIIIVWPVSIGILSTNFITFQYDPISAICYRRWPKHFNGKLWSAMISFVGYMLPIVVMMITFSAAGLKLWDKTLSAGNNFISKASLKRKKKAFVLLGFLIIAFFVCWSPVFGYLVLARSTKSVFPDGERGECARMHVLRFVFLIALCNTVADPVIYGFKGEEFRNGFYRMVHSITIKSKTTADTDALNKKLSKLCCLPS